MCKKGNNGAGGRTNAYTERGNTVEIPLARTASISLYQPEA